MQTVGGIVGSGFLSGSSVTQINSKGQGGDSEFAQKKSRLKAALAVGLAGTGVALFAAGCGGTSTTPPPPPVPKDGDLHVISRSGDQYWGSKAESFAAGNPYQIQHKDWGHLHVKMADGTEAWDADAEVLTSKYHPSQVAHWHVHHQGQEPIPSLTPPVPPPNDEGGLHVISRSGEHFWGTKAESFDAGNPYQVHEKSWGHLHVKTIDGREAWNADAEALIRKVPPSLVGHRHVHVGDAPSVTAQAGEGGLHVISNSGQQFWGTQAESFASGNPYQVRIKDWGHLHVKTMDGAEAWDSDAEALLSRVNHETVVHWHVHRGSTSQQSVPSSTPSTMPSSPAPVEHGDHSGHSHEPSPMKSAGMSESVGNFTGTLLLVGGIAVGVSVLAVLALTLLNKE
ncbi:MAG: hypothetical protein HYU64_21430 [Armatimonadetes bacterium]|nr:hypothetical protein [Armatimonadota bacterium]